MVKELKTKDFKDVISEGVSVLKFFTNSCVSCKMISGVYDEISEEFPEISFYSVDAEEEWEIVGELGILAVPTIITFKDGVEVARASGMMSKEIIIKLL